MKINEKTVKILFATEISCAVTNKQLIKKKTWFKKKKAYLQILKGNLQVLMRESRDALMF